MKKILVKSKIVVENETDLVTYFWKKTWWIFGYWYPFGCSSSTQKVSDEKINRINDKNVSKVVFDNFIIGFK